jgi:hypothetical protein
MFVPAFRFAMGRFDREVGHVRRYTIGSLTTAMRAAGLEVETAHYVNIPGLLAWFLGMRLLRMTPGDGGLLRIWDGQVIPRTRAFESKRKAPFGQSIFAVARVPPCRPTPLRATPDDRMHTAIARPGAGENRASTESHLVTPWRLG